MDRKRKGDEKGKADGYKMSDFVNSEMDMSNCAGTSTDTNLMSMDQEQRNHGKPNVVISDTSLSRMTTSDAHSPAVTALLSMVAEKDAKATSAIYLSVMEKKDSLARKQLPDHPLRLDGDRLKELQALYIKQKKLNTEVNVKCGEVNMDYQQQIKPLYQRRYEIVAGVNENDKGVPHFWLSALVAVPVLDHEITKPDELPLKHLMNINSYKTDAPKNSLKLEFIFDSSNPFFKNPVLTKVIHFKIVMGQLVAERTEGTRIDWNKNKCLTQRYGLKKGRKLRVEFKSFFHFFKSSDEYTDEDERLWTIAHHGRIANLIDDKILPHAFALYMDSKVSGKV